jgi:hypothetical protein
MRSRSTEKPVGSTKLLPLPQLFHFQRKRNSKPGALMSIGH